jgi:hypothetical protein
MKEKTLNNSKKLKVACIEFMVFLIIVLCLCLILPVTHYDLW